MWDVYPVSQVSIGVSSSCQQLHYFFVSRNCGEVQRSISSLRAMQDANEFLSLAAFFMLSTKIGSGFAIFGKRTPEKQTERQELLSDIYQLVLKWIYREYYSITTIQIYACVMSVHHPSFCTCKSCTKITHLHTTEDLPVGRVHWSHLSRLHYNSWYLGLLQTGLRQTGL